MLTVKYRNINITFENHTDLLVNRCEIDQLFSKLDILFRNISARSINKDSVIFVRLNGIENFSVYVGIGRKNNPYLFLYNAKTKEVSKDIPYTYFKLLNNNVIMGDLEDKICNISNSKYNNLLPPNIIEKIDIILQSEENSQISDNKCVELE